MKFFNITNSTRFAFHLLIIFFIEKEFYLIKYFPINEHCNEITQLAKKKRVLTRKQNASNREIKQNERKQKRQNMIEGVDLGRFFELATTDKYYVNKLNLHEIKNEILQDYKGDFKLNGST